MRLVDVAARVMLSRHLATLQTLLTEAQTYTPTQAGERITWGIYLNILEDAIKILQALVEWTERKDAVT